MADKQIIVYHYSYSPYARRIIWYLTLRGIPYIECIQPPIMPRPDISQLGVHYRRIPVVTIGRDVYLDTRLQLPKLEELYPSIPRLGVQQADHLAVQHLLSTFVNDGGLFTWAAQLLPRDLPLTKDPKFQKDRGDFFTPSKDDPPRGRAAALAAFVRAFTFMETTLLTDGREWVLKTAEPSLADIEAVWPFHWLNSMPGALPKDMFSPSKYPKVYAWVERFQTAVSAAKKRGQKPRVVSGEEAARLVAGAPFNEDVGRDGVDGGDPTSQGLKAGDRVRVWPTDTGRSHKDVGTLLRLDSAEVVIEVATADGTSVRIHAPRHGFAIQKVDSVQEKL
jgi:glutathione S-transferase